VKFKPPEDQTGPLTFGPRAVEAPKAIMLRPRFMCKITTKLLLLSETETTPVHGTELSFSSLHYPTT